MKYAAYGSNLHPERLQRRTGAVKLLGTTAVESYSLRFHKRGNIDGSGKCNIIRHNGAQIHVAVYEVSITGMEQLDIAEGVGDGYERGRIEVPDFGDCWTYLAQRTHIDELLSPFTWYKNLVLAGCRYHEFPGSYTRAIESVPATRDPDPKRHAIHRQLLEYG